MPVQRVRSDTVAQRCAEIRRERDGDQRSLTGEQGAEVVRGQQFELAAGLGLTAEPEVAERDRAPPGRLARELLERPPDRRRLVRCLGHRCSRTPFTLEQQRLDQMDEDRVLGQFALALRPPAGDQRLVGEPHGVGVPAIHEGAHRAEHGNEPQVEGLTQFGRHTGEGRDLRVRARDVAGLEQVDHPPRPPAQLQFAVAGALRQLQDLLVCRARSSRFSPPTGRHSA